MGKTFLDPIEKRQVADTLYDMECMKMSPAAMRIMASELLIQSIGEDAKREGLKETPNRVASMFDELFVGYTQNPEDILGTAFEDDAHQEMVIVRDIPFYSHCEHHMVPFFGKAHIAYIPQGRVVGISKLARLVDCFGRRLQIQERLTGQIADALNEAMKPKGVGVIIEAEHLCMTMRGVQKSGTSTITSAMRGVMLDNDNCARQELLMLLQRTFTE